MRVSDKAYQVAILSPRRVAGLAGVPSPEFWEWEEDMFEADFAVGTELKEELEKVSKTLLSELVKQEKKRRRTRRYVPSRKEERS